MGTKSYSYVFKKAPRCRAPRRVLSDPDTPDVAPREQWEYNVLEAVGEQRLHAFATHLTKACERLQAPE